MAFNAQDLWNTTGVSFLPSQVDALNTQAVTLGDVPAGTNVVTTPVPQASGSLSSSIGDFISSPFRNIGHMIGYAALAYGIYRLIKYRKLNPMTIGLIAGGIWGSGLWNNIKNMLPKDQNGQVNYMALAGLMVPNSTVRTAAGAALGGTALTVGSFVIPAIATFIANKLSSRKRTYRRRYNSYRPRRVIYVNRGYRR